MGQTRLSGWLIGMLGLMLLGRTAAAQAPAQFPAKVELISELSPPSSGRPTELWAAIVFHLDPGWHIYWKNPGDSGEPPRIQWSLPEGFQAGGIQWPVPKRLGHGSIVDYGYEGEVKLLQEISGPLGQQGKTAQDIALVADVKYVVCREICIPAKAHLPVTVSAGTLPPRPEEWRKWHQSLTAPMPKSLKEPGHASVEASGDHFILTVRGIGKVEGATFFPWVSNVVENSASQNLAQAPGGFQLTLKKSELLVGRPEILNGVLAADGGRAYEISAPIEWR